MFVEDSKFSLDSSRKNFWFRGKLINVNLLQLYMAPWTMIQQLIHGIIGEGKEMFDHRRVIVIVIVVLIAEARFAGTPEINRNVEGFNEE